MSDADSVKKGEPWGRIQRRWIKALRRRPNALAVLCALTTYADAKTGLCFPSIPVVGETTGLRDDAVIKAIWELVEIGIVTKVRRPKKSSQYTIHYESFVGKDDADTSEQSVVTPTNHSGILPTSGTREDHTTVSDHLTNQPSLRSGRERERDETKSEALSFSTWVLDLGLEYGVIPPHIAERKKTEARKSLKSARLLIKSYGLAACKRRAMLFVEAKRDGLVDYVDFSASGLDKVWGYSHLKTLDKIYGPFPFERNSDVVQENYTLAESEMLR